jgi:nucleolar MIF4G domain-containing protein 1
MKLRCVCVAALGIDGQKGGQLEKSSFTARLSASSSIDVANKFQKTPTMPRPQHNTTSLPRGLRAELGIRDTYGDKKRQRNGPANRKERRQAERNKKPGRPAAAPVKKNFQRQPQQNEDEDEDDFDLNEDEESSDDTAAVLNSKQASTKTQASNPKLVATKPERHLISLDEEEGDEDEEEGESDDDESDEDGDDESLPRGSHLSETVKSKLAQDDAEIAALEKKLGLKKGKKLPKAFAEDGLDELMGDLGEASEDDSKKRKREADEWLQSKRQKALQRQARASEEEDEDSEEDEDELDSEDEMDNLDEEIFGSPSDEEDAEDSEFDGFEDEEKAPPKKRENPYVAPVPKTETAAPQKYIPPSLRARGDPETEALSRLRRQAQGHLNKLSEANLVSILAEFEKLYRDHPRQNVTSTLINLLMALIAERSALNDTFIVLHAGFIAAVYKIMGMDFGAEIVQKIVETMDAGGYEGGKFEGKEYINLVSLLCQLYNFHVIGHPLMFDYIRLFLQEITETNTELLLKIIRSMCIPCAAFINDLTDF